MYYVFCITRNVILIRSIFTFLSITTIEDISSDTNTTSFIILENIFLPIYVGILFGTY